MSKFNGVNSNVVNSRFIRIKCPSNEPNTLTWETNMNPENLTYAIKYYNSQNIGNN